MNNNYLKSLNSENIWIDDNSVNKCYNCRDIFSLFNRRHHCRLCGKIYCYNCCNYIIKTNLETKLIIIDKYLDECLNNNNKLLKNKKLCYQCNNILLNIKNISNIIKIINILPIKLSDIYKLLQVNSIWYKAGLYYLHNLKKINYYTIFDNIKLSNFLNLNKKYISGHSKLVCLYIIENSHNWDLNNIKSELNYLEKKYIHCKSLLCNNNCTNILNDYDIIHILFKIKNNILKKYLLEKLKIKNIKIYLPLFVKLIEYEDINSYIITDFLLKKCENICIYIELFLQIFICIKNNNNLLYKNNLQKIKNELNRINSKKYDMIINSIKLINKISTIDVNKLENNIIEINNFIKENECYIPFSEKKIKFISSNIVIKDSNTKPIILEIYFIDNTYKKILLKNEDTRIDYIIYII